MKIDIITLFPKMFSGPFGESIIKRAQEKGSVKINVRNLRDWAKDKHKMVDDRPYGGGTGMVLMVEPLYEAVTELASKSTIHNRRVILLEPSSTPYNQAKAQELSKVEHLILIAGHYEAVDERVRVHLVDEVISIGDYVLTGGEIPVMVIVDSVVRLIPGVLEKEEAAQIESFEQFEVEGKKKKLLEYPQYTRPEEFKGWRVPEVLLTGDHKKIKNWRLEKAIERTKKFRPDLLED